jgi:uncharacterized protein (DUF433 family)
MAKLKKSLCILNCYADMATATIDYPRITRSALRGEDEPMITGSKIPVRIIAGYFQMGMSETEIMHGFPQLDPADIFSALAFYFDNKSEMDALIEKYGREYDEAKMKFNA